LLHLAFAFCKAMILCKALQGTGCGENFVKMIGRPCLWAAEASRVLQKKNLNKRDYFFV